MASLCSSVLELAADSLCFSFRDQVQDHEGLMRSFLASMAEICYPVAFAQFLDMSMITKYSSKLWLMGIQDKLLYMKHMKTNGLSTCSSTV